MSQIDKESVDFFLTGHTPVGTSSVQAIDKALPAGNKKGVLFKAPGPTDDTPNTVAVFIGLFSGVTANYNSDTGGFPLAPGESVVLPLEDAEHVYAIASSASQSLAWILV